MLSNETKGLDILNKKSYRRIINAVNNKNRIEKKSGNKTGISADLESGIPSYNAKNLKINENSIDITPTREGFLEKEQKDYIIVSPEETEEIPLIYYFYEYPEHKILDESNNYVAGYQLVIWQGNNYVVTIQPDIIDDKITSGELTLNWEQDAYNADEQDPEVWEDYKKKISNKKELQINKDDIMITPTREGFLYEYRTPEDIVIKKHYIDYEEEEMMAMFLDYIKEEEKKYLCSELPRPERRGIRVKILNKLGEYIPHTP